MAYRPIGTLGTIPTLTIGGRTFADLDNLISLFTSMNPAGRYGTCRKQNGSTTGYAAVNTLKIYAIKLGVLSSTGSAFKMMRSDNDVTFQSSTSPTNPTYFGNMNAVHFWVQGLGNFAEFAIEFNVTTGKYLTFDNNTNAETSVLAWGYDSV